MVYKRDIQYEVPQKSTSTCEAICNLMDEQGYLGGVFLLCGLKNVLLFEILIFLIRIHYYHHSYLYGYNTEGIASFWLGYETYWY